MLGISAPVVGNGEDLYIRCGTGTDDLTVSGHKSSANAILFGTTDGTGMANVKLSPNTEKPFGNADLSSTTGIFKGKKYLYFYVGQYSQSATEQTAGLNAELFNGKMERDMSNMNPSQTAKETIVGWSMPSNSYVEVTHSNGTYTAPANGYFQMSVNINDRQNPNIKRIKRYY